MYDLIIIGLGPAGLNAGVYANKANLKTLAIEKESPGGLLLKLKEIDNYLGFGKISGPGLALKFFLHFNNQDVEYKIENVLEIEDKKEYKIIKTNKNTYKTKNILITTGIKRKTLKEFDKYLGLGVSYCTVCDASLYKNKTVALIGNKEAITDAIYLNDIVSNLYFITEEEINGDFVINSKVKEIKKEEKFILKLENEKTIEVDGIFINLGNEFTSSFDKNLNIRNQKNFIEVDKNMETKIRGIYAAGDVIEKDLRQICTAISDAAIAVDHIKRNRD